MAASYMVAAMTEGRASHRSTAVTIGMSNIQIYLIQKIIFYDIFNAYTSHKPLHKIHLLIIIKEIIQFITNNVNYE